MSDLPLSCSLRQRRTAAGLSQRDLAAQVGVSRQALIAIEAGRQVPSTTLALHLARALRCSVEDLFALAGGSQLRARIALPAGGDGRARAERADGTRVVVGRVDGSWVAHGAIDEAQPADGVIVEAHGEGRVTVDPLADRAALEHNVLVAGCAPLIGTLAGRVGRRYADLRATWIPADSARSLALLQEGLVHVAGLHLVGAHEQGGHEAIVADRFGGRRASLVHLTRWRQGFVVAPGNPLGIRSAADLARREIRFAHRSAGSGAEVLLRRILAAEGIESAPPGPVAAGHAEVARLVRWGVADVGVAIEAAAIGAGLDFVPLSEERFDLIVLREREAVPGVARLIALLDAPAFRSEAACLPGYDLSMAGHAATVGR